MTASLSSQLRKWLGFGSQSYWAGPNCLHHTDQHGFHSKKCTSWFNIKTKFLFYHHFVISDTFSQILHVQVIWFVPCLHFKSALNTILVTGKVSSLLKPYPQYTLAFFKLISLLFKWLSTNSSKVFPNYWLSFVIPTTQKWHPNIKQSFACLRDLKELCPRFILLLDALKQNYFKGCLSVERLFCRS